MRNSSDKARIVRIVTEKLSEEFNVSYEEILNVLLKDNALEMINDSNLSVKETMENLYKKGCCEVSLVLKLKEERE